MEKQHIQLIIKAFVLVVGWIFLYDYLLEPDGRLDEFLTEKSTVVSSYLLTALGYSTAYVAVNGGQELYMGEVPLLGVGHACNGLILYTIFIGLILIFPATFRNKLIMSLIGITVIFLMNIGRIVSLCLIYLYHPSFFNVSHKFIFTTILYGVIFLLWMFYVNQILKKKAQTTCAG